jgi:hypothetical protein
MCSLKLQNNHRKGLFVVSMALGLLTATNQASAQAQPRQCSLSGSLTLILPNDPVTTARPLQALYTETGPFLAPPASPASVDANIQFTPPAVTVPPWLLAPILETMGDCEGPLTFTQLGDGGTSTHDFGSFGQIVDQFSVSALTPNYVISHTLSGTLNFANLPPLGSTDTIERDADVTISSTQAAGAISIARKVATGGTQLFQGTFSATYTTHSQVPLPWRCRLQSAFNGINPANGNFTGTTVRQQVVPPPAPAMPAAGALALVLLLLPAGVWAIRDARRKGARSA